MQFVLVRITVHFRTQAISILTYVDIAIKTASKLRGYSTQIASL